MPKILNFTAVEILPALLSKAKTQTIRPAWVKFNCKNCDESKEKYNHIAEKPARFKVGDEVKLMWNQRSKYFLFNKETGLSSVIS